MTGITDIYMQRQIGFREDNVRVQLQGENMDCTFTVSFECLLEALRKDLDLEVKE